MEKIISARGIGAFGDAWVISVYHTNYDTVTFSKESGVKLPENIYGQITKIPPDRFRGVKLNPNAPTGTEITLDYETNLGEKKSLLIGTWSNSLPIGAAEAANVPQLVDLLNGYMRKPHKHAIPT